MFKNNLMTRFGKKEKGILFMLIGILVIGFTAGVLYQHYNGDLSSGEFNNTLYNSSGSYVYLNYTDDTNSSYVESGEYISDVIDFGDLTEFHSIKWKGKGNCSEGMAYIDKLGGYCIDKYEAYNAGSSVAGSASGETPWVSITQTDARTACENAGKRLCTDKEWLGAANMQGQVYNLPSDLSVAPYGCNTNTAAAESTGSNSGCVSAEGVYDMVGNVWEWTNESGITTISPSGSAAWHYPSESGDFQTSTDADTELYGDDGVYFDTGTTTGRAVRRGGPWNHGASAGPFCAYLNDAPSDTGAGIGFRCCSN